MLPLKLVAMMTVITRDEELFQLVSWRGFHHYSQEDKLSKCIFTKNLKDRGSMSGDCHPVQLFHGGWLYATFLGTVEVKTDDSSSLKGSYLHISHKGGATAKGLCDVELRGCLKLLNLI